MTCEVVKNDTCVLIPRECSKMFDLMTPVYRAICEALLYSHMRIEELRWFIAHPEVYKPSRRCISLSKEAIGKKRTLFKERDVVLSIKGCHVIEHLISLKLKERDMMSRQAMNVYLDKTAVAAGLGKEHICPKMFRKSMISWLVAVYPEKHVWINSSAGHTADVQLKHYLGIAFERRDLEDMRDVLKGWGET